ncbi:type II CAAX endopeptidase family protein [Oleiagrimonas sp.]|jgi:membrane protease YdiL (CAAX protease family)|uniref:CPBP family intramembrane glutamic endopeptidase n=1 Tax=Oleiagrimonas sp. TaxID=2010330 RepID=UPI00262CBAD7|nr:type II CAAX endopeptidase family protein [Oleiagrimonas sp.]MDA3914137.1 type II CAAX endopeptidase family protein [Oleiagrimonas sp.]
MNSWELAYTTPASASGWTRWLIFSPGARLILFVLLFVASSFGVGMLLHLLGWMGKGVDVGRDLGGLVQLLIRAVPAVVAYLLLVFAIERRSPAELSWRTLVPHALAGLALGVVLLSVVMGVLALAGSFHVLGTGGDVHWLAAILSVGLGAGISEEIFFRGALFRIVEEGLGTWIALLVSALAFGAIHLGNANATLWSGLAIAIEAGILFGLVYHVTRSLWLCMGLHAAWNMMEGPVFGTSVSGLTPHGWLKSSLTGPDWLSGGPFGPEASLVTVACCLLLSLVFVVIAIRRNSIVPPGWMRRDGGRP